ncbi:MAG: glutathione S-transferase family protein [Robiginitomaculum sp.]|nr:glutathione S-transferase family protein [Robiginitomaculum sp.]
MIKLFQPPPAFNAANPSPFCIKLEVLLKMSGLPYEIIIEGDPRKGPTGKIPFVEIAGERYGDSNFIQKKLQHDHGTDFDKELSDKEKSISLAFTRLIEEHLYWVLLYSRWMEDANWPIINRLFFGSMPIPLKWFLPNVIRKQVEKQLYGHGVSRLPKTVMYKMAADDLAAIAGFLENKETMFGGEPTALDATLYGILSSIIDADFDTELKRSAMAHQNLVAYTSNMRQRYFPELPKPT